MDITPSHTERGFALGTFKDRYGAACSIQKSSVAIEDAIWLGVDLEDGKGRMHLTREGVEKLLPVLQRFVETGELTFG